MKHLSKQKKKNKLKLDELEIIDKKFEIELKKVEIRKEKTEINESIIKKNIAYDEQGLLLQKINEIRWLLSDLTIDDERTILGSEPFIRPTFKGRERTIIMRKLIELVQQVK